MNEFLAAAPDAEVAHGVMGCMVSLNDLCDRRPCRSPTTRCSTSGRTGCATSTRRTCPTAGKPACSTTRRPTRCLAGDLFSNLGDPRASHVRRHRRRRRAGRRHVRRHRASRRAPRRRSGGWPSSRRPRSPSCTARRSPATAPLRFVRSPTTTRRVSRRRRCAARSGRTRAARLPRVTSHAARPTRVRPRTPSRPPSGRRRAGARRCRRPPSRRRTTEAPRRARPARHRPTVSAVVTRSPLASIT